MGDVSPFWDKIFEALATVDGAVDLALQAAAPDATDKAVSAITKKRLAQRSQQSLTQSKSVIQHLSDSLRALQKTAREWQNSADYASKSQRELMEQAEAMSMDLQSTVDQVRRTEAARLTMSREAHDLKLKVAELEAERQVKEAELLASQAETAKARDELADTLRQMDQVREEAARQLQEAAQCRQDAAHAAGALDAARAEAERTASLAQRHQEVVAQLTADNLVLLMQLRKAEAELEGALQERQQLRLAVERQKGPWFAEVRAGVEAKVKEAMARAEELEQQLQDTRLQHQAELQQLAQEKAELESFLEASRTQEARLASQLEEATASANKLEQEARSAAEVAEEQRGRAADLAAQVRALLDSARDMREECNERWAKQQAAESQAGQLAVDLEATQVQLQQLQGEVAHVRAGLHSQVAINRQLMARKEEMEWQLMSTVAEASGGEPLPLSVTVSGRMQVNPPGLPSTSHPPQPPSAPTNSPGPFPAEPTPTRPPPPTSPAPPPSPTSSSAPSQPPHITASNPTPLPSTSYPPYPGTTSLPPLPPSSPSRPATAPVMAVDTTLRTFTPRSHTSQDPALSTAGSRLPLSSHDTDNAASAARSLANYAHLGLPPRPASATATLPPRPAVYTRLHPASSTSHSPEAPAASMTSRTSSSTSPRGADSTALSGADVPTQTAEASEVADLLDILGPVAEPSASGGLAEGQEATTSRRRAAVDVFLAPQAAA